MSKPKPFARAKVGAWYRTRNGGYAHVVGYNPYLTIWQYKAELWNKSGQPVTKRGSMDRRGVADYETSGAYYDKSHPDRYDLVQRLNGKPRRKLAKIEQPS